MKNWLALSGLILAANLCVTSILRDVQAPTEGKAYITQAVPASLSKDYDLNFGDSWQSVRIFRLLQPLDKPLKIYIDTHGKAQAGFKPQYKDYIVESLRLWDEALSGRLKYSYTENRSEADINVEWVPAFPDRYVAGLTTYRVGHATIEIKVNGVPEGDIKGNIIHEFGHALGISGHSNQPDDIMVGMRKWRRDNAPYTPKLSSRDVQAIRRLYSQDWKKGEDLYASNAQIKRLAPVANPPTIAKSPSKPQQTAITLQPFDDTDVLQWREAQSREAEENKAAPQQAAKRSQSGR